MKLGSNSPWAWALRIAILALLAFGIGLVIAGVGKASDSSPPPELTGIAQEMRKKPADWGKVEKDGSALIADLRAGAIDAVGIAGSSVLVANKAGEKYFVVDGRGAFAALVLSSLRPEKADEGSGPHGNDAVAAPTPPEFQIVVLPNVTLGTPPAAGMSLTVARDIAGLLIPLLLIGFLVYMVKGEVLNTAKVVENPQDLKFDDVVGAEEAKRALTDVVSYLKNPEMYAALGARPPGGVLMLGGPGVGKTLLAKALAGECGANFIATNGSEFTSKFYGAGVQKVKSLFAKARKNAPCILFIDEIDGISKRTQGNGTSADAESNRIINQVLVEMDGFQSNRGVIVVGATNFTDSLDPALLREGRFDRRVTVNLPDVRDRIKILKLYARKIRVSAGSIDYEQLARLTTGLSPATLAYIVNHAALLAARKDKVAVTMADLVEAIETARIGELNGTERTLSEAERKRIAVHESGHAVVAAVLGCGNVEKVTILPRGGALGVTLVTPDDDKSLNLKSDIENRIQMLLGGRNAELAVYGEASTGAAHDLQEASRLALDMVGKFGFSPDGALFSLTALPAQYAGDQVASSVQQANLVLTELDSKCRDLIGMYNDVMRTLADELVRDEEVPGSRVLELVAAVSRKAA